MATNHGGRNRHKARRSTGAPATKAPRPSESHGNRTRQLGTSPGVVNRIPGALPIIATFALTLLVALAACGSDGPNLTQQPDSGDERTSTPRATTPSRTERATPSSRALTAQPPAGTTSTRTPATGAPATSETPSTTAAAARSTESGTTSVTLTPTPSPVPGPTPIPPSLTSNATDIQALIALRDANPEVINENWNDNWFEQSIGSWRGVNVKNLRVGSDGVYRQRVRELNFSSWGLSSEIPAEFGNLTEMQSLVMRGNNLTGSIPPEFGNLVNLYKLDLSHNKLTGEIPSELGNLSNLTLIYLTGNNLTGEIPPELASLANLEHLRLQGNQLDGCIPHGLKANGIRVDADLMYCLDPAFANTSPKTDRDVLIAFKEPLRRQGGHFGRWGSDAPLSRWNGVTTNGQGRVTEIEFERPAGVLGYVSSEDRGVMTRDIGYLSELRVLILVDSLELRGTLPPDLGRLTKLETLSLTGQINLNTHIPATIGNLTKLRHLEILGGLSGEIPRELGQLSNLEYLALDGNFTGEFPQELGNLTNLKYLALGGTTRMSGCIPDSLRSVLDTTGYWTLQLCAARAAGEQQAARTRAALTALYNSTDGPNWDNNENWLSDKPLEEWNGVTTNSDGEVIGITLFWNGLSGQLPAALGDLSNLGKLYLYGNQLTGRVPAQLANLTSLRELYLNQNSLTGCVPAALRNQLDMNNSDLGELPFC